MHVFKLMKGAAVCGLLSALLLVSRDTSAQTIVLPTPTVTAPSGPNIPRPPINGAVFPRNTALLPVPTAVPDLSADSSADSSAEPLVPIVTQPPTPEPTPILPQPTPTPETITGPVTVGIAAAVPEEWAAPLLAILNNTAEVQTANGPQPLNVLAGDENAPAQITVLPGSQAAHPLAAYVLAAVAPFATIDDDVSLSELEARWRGEAEAGGLLVSADAARWLQIMWGAPAEAVQTVPAAEMAAQLQAADGSVGIVAFTELDPTLKALTVDGVNVLSNQFQANRYPLAVTLSVEGAGSSALAPLLQDAVQPATNRDAAKLTQLIMTGVTAMSRVTALRMDQKGYDYPARVISDVFAAADITHISNEVPFLDDCIANPTENNLILCSDTDYWAALAALGTDIVGLSGNHVNDFGREGARRSLQWYRDNQIPIYGSGMNVDEACAPLLWEDHGNSFAFIAALAFDPPGAWASADQPGACYYYDNKERILALVSELAGQVDVVAVELQHQETYEPYPIPLQVAEFRELRAAGADIVSGVQSHVPQAQEPYGPQEAGGSGFISYGFGNLFFDQMWSWATRTELAARHTVYNGALINTEILTMVLEDFAQPRWTTAEERADLLSSIFAAAPQK